MEKRSGRVELRQSAHRKNHYNRHKSGKFGAFVEGAQYDFPDPDHSYHGRRWRRRPNLPVALDDPVEGVHTALPLAVLRALVDARRRLSAEARPVLPIPEIRPASGIPVCCDNFA
jgi:hypothetical protein